MKLIVIRGNSGSGKSTLSLALRQRLIEDGVKIAIISQDYFRRFIIKEKDRINDTDIIKLLKLNVEVLIGMNYTVILEGILSSSKYGPMLKEFNRSLGSDNSVFFYYDVSFEETLKRHSSKPNRHEFGEKEMRDWQSEKDTLNLSNEHILKQNLSVERAVDKIMVRLKAL